jgi:hypothetical protein
MRPLSPRETTAADDVEADFALFVAVLVVLFVAFGFAAVRSCALTFVPSFFVYPLT